jgi:hypothetical protein
VLVESPPLRLVVDDVSWVEPERTGLLPSELSAIVGVFVSLGVLLLIVALCLWRRRLRKKMEAQAAPLNDYVIGQNSIRRKDE